MTEDEFTPARKRQFMVGFFMMVLVLVLAMIAATHGEDIYMALQDKPAQSMESK